MARIRTFRRAAATAAVTALLGSTVLVPTTAHAAGVAPSVTVTVLAPVPRKELLPGGPGESFTVTAANETDAPLPFDGQLPGVTVGHLPIGSRDVKISVEPMSAPATAFVAGQLRTEYLGRFYPAGSTDPDTPFTVPAHTTYTWKVTVAATKTWPAGDSQLAFQIEQSHNTLYYRVGHKTTNGRFDETMTVSGDGTAAPHRPLFMNLNLTNNTGAAIASPLRTSITFSNTSTGPNALTVQDLQVWLWNGKAWVALKGTTYSWQLPLISAHFPNGGKHTYRLMVSLNSHYKKSMGGGVDVWAATRFTQGNTYPFWGVDSGVFVD
jgi:hypothetical protein